MRILILFNLLFLLAASQIAAQNQDSLAIKKYYEQNAILWLGWTKYIKNNKSFPLKNLKKEIIFSPDAIHEFSLYRRNRTYLNVSTVIGSGLFVSSFVAKDTDTRLRRLAISMAVLTFSIPISFNTSKHLSRSIWLHNRDILLR